MYATDGRTDRQKQSLLPLPYGRGHNNNNDMNNNNNNSAEGLCRSYLNPRQSYKYFGFGKTNVSHFNWNFIPVAT